MSLAQYDPWLVKTLKELIDAAAINDGATVQKLIVDIEKGLQYGRATPGSISSTLMTLAEKMLEPMRATFAQEMRQADQELNVGELKSVLEKRKKTAVLNKMSGSLSSLKDFDDQQ